MREAGGIKTCCEKEEERIERMRGGEFNFKILNIGNNLNLSFYFIEQTKETIQELSIFV